VVLVAAVVVAVAACSAAIKDPGFMRLLSIPALPVLGGVLGHVMTSPVILVTNRRIMSAGRMSEPLLLDLERLKALPDRALALVLSFHVQY
jgi:hypothetical protein